MNPPDDPLLAYHDPSLWGENHPVSRAFQNLAKEVLDRRERGIGRLSADATTVEARFQHSRLASIAASDTPTDNADIAAIEAWASGSPVSAILYAAAQASAHYVLRDRSLDERAVNSSVHNTLLRRLSDIANAYKYAGCSLPQGKYLCAGAAKMERTKDHMGADLAIVVGASVLGLPRFRVVLIQAKHAHTRDRNGADVGHNEGRQLDDLLSTGMGYYLFYPRVVAGSDGRDTRLLPTLRSAPAVFADVAASASTSGRYKVGCHATRDGTVDATDFAEFVAFRMASDDLSVGRLFPSVQKAADALIDEGKPIVPEVLALDRSGRLSILEFLDAMQGYGLNRTGDVSFRKYEELKSDHERDFPSSPSMW